MDELDDGGMDVVDLQTESDPILGALHGVAVTGRAYEALVGLSAVDDDVPDESCACRCGCEHAVGAHGPAICQDCRHGRHRDNGRRSHR